MNQALEQKTRVYFDKHPFNYSKDTNLRRELNAGELRTMPAKILESDFVLWSKEDGGLEGHLHLVCDKSYHGNLHLSTADFSALLLDLGINRRFTDINAELKGKEVVAYFYGPWVAGISAVPEKQ